MVVGARAQGILRGERERVDPVPVPLERAHELPPATEHNVPQVNPHSFDFLRGGSPRARSTERRGGAAHSVVSQTRIDVSRDALYSRPSPPHLIAVTSFVWLVSDSWHILSYQAHRGAATRAVSPREGA